MQFLSRHKTLLVVLLVACALRLIYGLAQNPLAVYDNLSGDGSIYLQMGHNLTNGFDYSEISLPTAPLYLIFNGVWQNWLPDAEAVIAIRVVQTLMSTTLCFFVYRLSLLISQSERAGFIAAAVLAVSPVFVVEAAQIMTETLFMFLLALGLWVYVECTARLKPPAWAFWVLIGAVFGLATLTRAVLLIFPLGLAVHLVMLYGWRLALRRFSILFLAYALVVSSWTIHNLVHWNRFVLVAQGFAAFVYIGATDWEGAAQVDENLANDAGVEGELPSDVGEQQELYQQAAANVIASDPLGYAYRRVTELAEAYMQPHGTLLFGGAGIKELLGGWLREDRTLSGLAELALAPGFWPKLALYLFHYAGLLFGLAGMWLTRRRWRVTLPLIGFMVYTTLIHLFLDAIPRYLFPTQVFWWIFAAAALAHLMALLRRRTGTKQSANPQQWAEDPIH